MTKKLSDEELGKRLAEAAGWKVKEFSPQKVRDYFHYITHSSEWRYQKDGDWLHCYDLCSSLDAIAEVEELIIKKDGLMDAFGKMSVLGNALYSVINPYGSNEDLENEKLRGYLIYSIFSATARQRAEAALAALQTLGD